MSLQRTKRTFWSKIISNMHGMRHLMLTRGTGKVLQSAPKYYTLKAKLYSALVGFFYPHRNDDRGIERWGRKVWEEPDLCCRKLTNGRVLFFFPSTQRVISASNIAFPVFCGATLSLSPWSQELVSFKAQRVWLRTFDIPLHAWTPETFRSILGACGSLVSIHWKLVEFPPMGSI
ncbi:hypothetical protein AMTRI_Chr09g39730 [Amborella trichopoda]